MFHLLILSRIKMPYGKKFVPIISMLAGFRMFMCGGTPLVSLFLNLLLDLEANWLG